MSKIRKSLQKVYEELDNTEFIFIDRGCIVNLIHVMRISGGMAVLKNGEELSPSAGHMCRKSGSRSTVSGGAAYDGWVEVIAYFLTNEIRVILGLMFTAILTDRVYAGSRGIHTYPGKAGKQAGVSSRTDRLAADLFLWYWELRLLQAVRWRQR